MKRIIKEIVLTAVLLSFTACSNNESPKEVVRLWYETQMTIEYDDDVAFDMKHASKKTQDELNSMSDGKIHNMISEMNRMRQRNKESVPLILSYEIISEEINGDEAIVKTKISYKKGEYNQEESLIKDSDGVWHMKH